jgi:transcriptional regulator with XRE-family HTH domain
MLTNGIGELLRKSRKALGLTQKAAALRVGVSERLWAEVERGERPNVSLETALRMLGEVGITVRLDDPLGSSHVLLEASSARAARAALRRKTWTGRQIRLSEEGRDEPRSLINAGLGAVAQVSQRAYAVAKSRRSSRQ